MMYIKSLMLVMMLTCVYTAQAQTSNDGPKRMDILGTLFQTPSKKEEVHLNSKHINIGKSWFSRVEVIDTRFDTSVIGFVVLQDEPVLSQGALHPSPQSLQFIRTTSQSLKDEIILSVNNLLSGAAKQEGTLLINIRKFYVAGGQGYMHNQGRIIFKAGYYLKQDTIYRQLFTVDTTINVKLGRRHTTDHLRDTLSSTFSKPVQYAAGFDAVKYDTTKQFTAYDIEHIDELEKGTIPVYNTAVPKRGIYLSYDDLKNNTPTQANIIAEYKKGFSRPLLYEMAGDNKKGNEISRKDFYAVSDGEKIFISAVYGLYPLIKRNGDFYFSVGKTDQAHLSTSTAAIQMYDALAGMAPFVNTWPQLEFKIDHITGRFLPILKNSN